MKDSLYKSKSLSPRMAQAVVERAENEDFPNVHQAPMTSVIRFFDGAAESSYHDKLPYTGLVFVQHCDDDLIWLQAANGQLKHTHIEQMYALLYMQGVRYIYKTRGANKEELSFQSLVSAIDDFEAASIRKAS